MNICNNRKNAIWIVIANCILVVGLEKGLCFKERRRNHKAILYTIPNSLSMRFVLMKKLFSNFIVIVLI